MEPQPKLNKPIKKRKKGITKPQYKNLNSFKAQEKRYKLYYGIETDYSQLFQPREEDFIIVDGFKVCELPFPKGAYYVKNFNPVQTVIDIGLYGLNLYSKRPYRTNLDSREELYQDNEEDKKQENDKAIEQEIIEEEKDKGYHFNDKIRWANVGYQYDWTLRKYPDKKTPIHTSIRQLSDRANQLFNNIHKTDHKYEPESAIVNFYGLKDYMTGHLDDAQIDQISPIYSFSFGLSCVFVIGGPTRDEKPTSVKLDSGDLLIMSGDSRRCYHGVPRVIQESFTKPQQIIEKSKIVQNVWINKQEEVLTYYQTHRININIRQVYPQQQK